MFGGVLTEGLTTPGSMGAGHAPDKETEMKIREELEKKWALEKKSEEEARKSKPVRRSIV